MYVVPLITFFAEDSLVSVSDRLMTTSTRTNWAPYGPGFGWMLPESAISLLRYRCVRMSDLNLILGGNLIRGFKVRA